MTCTTISYKWFDRNGVLAGSDICRMQDIKERVQFFLDECKHRDYVNLSNGKIVLDFAQEVLDGCVLGELKLDHEILPQDMDDFEAKVCNVKHNLLAMVRFGERERAGQPSESDLDDTICVKLACDREEEK